MFGANQCNSTHCRKSVVHFYRSHPCTTIRHTEKVLSAAATCYGTKTKRFRISLIYRIICFNLRNIAQQKRSFEKDLVSGKRDSNPRPPAWKASALSTELFPQNNLWAVMDSNHRRLRQLSYSQPHLATLVTAQL